MEKARRFCAWRERCTREVEEKLQRLGAGKNETAQAVRQLRTEGFVNDERFAALFARGKFANNKWGKVKIAAALKKRDIPGPVIRTALEGIPEQEYAAQLNRLIRDKHSELETKGKPHIAAKTAAYCIQKGYEPDLVWTLLGDHPGNRSGQKTG